MRIDVLGVGFDNYTMEHALESARQLMQQPGGHYVVTPNSEILAATRNHEESRKAFAQADMVLPDGIGVVKASRMLGRPLKERVAGIDFAQSLMQGRAGTGKRFFLLGAAEGVAERAMELLSVRYPDSVFCGCRNGFFSDEEEVVESLKSSHPDILFVCLGAPKQELFMSRHLNSVGDCLMVGLGGCLNVWAGDVKRAPEVFIKLGLEWFHRLITQPSRIGRMMKLPYFLLLVRRQRRAERKSKREVRT